MKPSSYIAFSGSRPPALLPAWPIPLRHDFAEADAALSTGIALKSLDDLVRSEPN